MQARGFVTVREWITDAAQSTAVDYNRSPDRRKGTRREMSMKEATNSTPMKSNQAPSINRKKTIISLIVFASTFAFCAAPDAQARQCSNASLKGAYGFLDAHVLLPAGTPFTAIGRWKFDGKGNFTNTLTVNDNGTVTHQRDSGSYTVNDDCTGTISIMGGQGNVEIVIVNGGNEFYELVTNPSSIVSTFSVAKKQFPDDDDNSRR
jgi:hypothetical protein